MSPIRAHLLSDEEDVQSIDKESSCQEFVIAVEDLESVISYNATDDRTYNMRSKIKKKEFRSLDHAFTELDEKRMLDKFGRKRFKISETKEASDPLYGSNELINYCEKVNSYSLTLNNSQKARYVAKIAPGSSNPHFFLFLKEELESLAKIYGLSTEEIHSKFMDVSCDFGVLKYVLRQELKGGDALIGSKFLWNGLQDLAIQGSKDSPQYRGLSMEKTRYEIKKRQEFLMTLKDWKF